MESGLQHVDLATILAVEQRELEAGGCAFPPSILLPERQHPRPGRLEALGFAGLDHDLPIRRRALESQSASRTRLDLRPIGEPPLEPTRVGEPTPGLDPVDPQRLTRPELDPGDVALADR